MHSLTHTLLIGISWFMFPTAGLLGLIAIVNPGVFLRLANHAGRWIDSEKLLKSLDRPHDIDRHVLRYPRVLGVLVMAAVTTVGLLYIGS